MDIDIEKEEENGIGNTFITQDQSQGQVNLIDIDLDQSSNPNIIKNEDGLTLLARKRAELKRVDDELKKTRESTDEIIEKVRLGQLEFQKKQKAFFIQVSQFEKFVNDSDRKRAMKDKETKKIGKSILSSQNKIDSMKIDKDKLKNECISMKMDLENLEKYLNYLKITASETNGSIDDLIRRYLILKKTRIELFEKLTKIEKEKGNLNINYQKLFLESEKNLFEKNGILAGNLKNSMNQ